MVEKFMYIIIFVSCINICYTLDVKLATKSECDCGDGECELDKTTGDVLPCVCEGKRKKKPDGTCKTCDCGDGECKLDETTGDPLPCICEGKLKKKADGTCKKMLGCKHLGGQKNCDEQHRTCINDKIIKEFFKCGDCINGFKEEGNVCIANPCENEFNPCPRISTECISTDKDYFCKCKTGYELQNGIEEEENKLPCIKMKCDCGVNSYWCHWTEEGMRNCTCKEGYFQIKGICSRICKDDYECLHGGKCIMQWNAFDLFNSSCECKNGYTGDNCEIKECCQLDCEKIGAACHHLEGLTKGYCICPHNKSFNENTKQCEDRLEYTSFFYIALSAAVICMILSTFALLFVFIRFRRNIVKK